MKHIAKTLISIFFFSFFVPSITAKTNVYLVNNTDFEFTRETLIKRWRGWKEIVKWRRKWENKDTSKKTTLESSIKIKPHSRIKIFSVNRGHKVYGKFFQKSIWQKPAPIGRQLATFEKIETTISSPKANYTLPIKVESKGKIKPPPGYAEGKELTVSIKAPKNAKIKAHYKLLTKLRRYADVEIILDPIGKRRFG